MKIVKSTDRTPAPPRVLIYGAEGVGKTTWACQAPTPLVLATEDGLGVLAVDYVAITSWAQLVEAIQALAGGSHPEYRTIVIDSLDAAERMCWQHVAEQRGVQSIEAIGYQAGYRMAAEQQAALRDQLDAVHCAGRWVVCIAHAEAVEVQDPTAVTYTRWQPRLHRRSLPVWCDWVDVIGYAHVRVAIRQEQLEFGEKRNIAAPCTERMLRLAGTPAVTAKSRYPVPDELPLAWQAFEAYVRQSQKQNRKES